MNGCFGSHHAEGDQFLLAALFDGIDRQQNPALYFRHAFHFRNHPV
jgi:hypothetical protein